MKQMDQMERRQYRKKRRRRNQLLAFLFLITLMIAAVVGTVLGIRWINQEKEQEAKENASALLDILDSEEPLYVEKEEPEEETEPEPTPEELLEQKIDAYIEAMTLEEKAAGLFIVTPESITGVTAAVRAQEGTRDALERYPVGGIVYFAKNIQSYDQLKEMITNTRAYSKHPLFIAVDEEGGSVNRIAGSGLAAKEASAKEVAGTGDANNAYLSGAAIGAYLAKLGFDLDFAPVADLANVPNSVMEGRSYGSDPALASTFVVSMMQGLEEQNVTACLKHFPGLGSTEADTHEGIAVSKRTAQEFRTQEFAVFKAGIDAGANMIMVGHMAAPSLVGENDNTPASLSSIVVTQILREELGFEGVIITDALNMSAISEYYESDQAVITALKAGCDMVLMPDDFEKAYHGVLKAVNEGVISEERIDDSLRRIYRIKFGE